MKAPLQVLKDIEIAPENLPLSALKWTVAKREKQTVKKRFSPVISGQLLTVVYVGKPVL